MIKSEIAFIPNNLSSHSLQLNNFIEQQASEDNSEPRSSRLSKKNGKQSQKNVSKSPSFIHNYSNSHHVDKIAHQIQNLEFNLDDKNSLLDTPVHLFNKPVGRYQFTPQAFPTEEQLLVEAITTQLNQIQMKDDKINFSEIQTKKKAAESTKKEENDRQYEQLKVVNPMQEIQTDFSQLSRDIKIFEHRYESNLAVLHDQTKELLSYYQYMIQQQQQKQLRKQIMMLQIHNHRTKISLRNASYSKRFNYISPIPKNNDKPLQFRGKFKVQKHLVDKLDELCQSIKEEQAVWEQQEARLTLLTKYYNIMKNKVIVNNIENQADYRYDSQLERYTNRQQSIKHSQIAIDVPFTTTNGLNFSSANSIHGTNYSIKQSLMLKKGLAHPQMPNSPKKKVQAEIVEPYQQYNLLKYKTEISKEMIVQYQVYNLGRLKRIKYQNRMIKKELQFIDQHIQHFDKSFAEELKKYEQKSKPKITYQSFKTLQQETPYTRSPISRDYYGNSKGCNTINLYRPDSKDPTHIKSNPKSRPNINKSLSQSKYTIKREPTINLSNSKKDITLSQNFILTQNDRTSEKSGTVVSFFRNKVTSPQKSSRKQACLYTSKKELASIKQAQPMNSSSKKISLTLSRNSLSPRSKNLLRFNSKPQTQLSIDNKSIKSPRLRLTGNTGKNTLQQKKQTQSEYCLSLDAQLSNH